MKLFGSNHQEDYEYLIKLANMVDNDKEALFALVEKIINEELMDYSIESGILEKMSTDNPNLFNQIAKCDSLKESFTYHRTLKNNINSMYFDLVKSPEIKIQRQAGVTPDTDNNYFHESISEFERDTQKKVRIILFDDGNLEYKKYNNEWVVENSHHNGDKLKLINGHDKSIIIKSISTWKTEDIDVFN